MEKKLIEHYDPQDEKYLDWCINEIKTNPHQRKTADQLKNSRDPLRLNTIATTLSNVKRKLLKTDRYRHREYDTTMDIIWDDFRNDPAALQLINSFNEKTVVEQLKDQRAMPNTDLGNALAIVPIVPENLRYFALDDRQSDQRAKLNTAISKTKSESEPRKWTGAVLLTVLEGLKTNDTKKLIPAILLASGRRSREIQLTGVFQPVEDNRYAAIFSGQAKSANPDEKYQIPLLAPYSAFIKAFNLLRELLPPTTPNLPTIYRRACHPVNPHAYRSAYANACEELFNEGRDKITFNGYISKILGHQDPKTSINYARSTVDKPLLLRIPVIPERKEILSPLRLEFENRIDQLLEFMATGQKITQNTLLKKYGGHSRTWKTLLSMNPDIIKRYNNSI